MSQDLLLLHCMLLLQTPSAVELSVWMDVCPCGWPISISALRAGMASRALRKMGPISALAALNITVLIEFVVLSTALLLAGIGTSLAKKKCPPARLRALGSLRYDASLCANPGKQRSGTQHGKFN